VLCREHVGDTGCLKHAVRTNQPSAPEGIGAFRRFEAAVLPLIPECGARLERRLRTLDGRFEIHIASFPSGDALDRYRADR
jgi:hypothetical protein